MTVLSTINLADQMKRTKIGELRVKVTLGRSFPIRIKLCLMLCRLAAWVCPMQLDVVEE